MRAKARSLCLLVNLTATACTFRHGSLSEDPNNNQNSYTCHCDCTWPTTAVLDERVRAAADDAEQDTAAPGAMTLHGTALDMTRLGTQLVGLRFDKAGLPQGSTILSATIQFTASGTDSVAASLHFVGESSGSAATFTSTDGDISNRAPLTAAAVDWTPDPWVAGDAGAAEATPDLSSVVQELVNRPDWTPNSAILFVVSGTGNRSADSYDQSSSQAPKLHVTYKEPKQSWDLPVCMTAADNPNNNPDHVTGDLGADCSGRVQTTLHGLDDSCNYPSDCSCSFQDQTTLKYVDTCNNACDEVALQKDASGNCTNFQPPDNVTATNAAGDQPVCLVHSPLASFLFGQRSQCNITSGMATFATSDETESSAATGTMDIVGPPCPGATCLVGFSYLLDFGNVTFGNLFESATFSQLTGVGATAPGNGASLGSDGKGLLAPSTTASSGRGRRDNGDVLALFGPNDNVINVGAFWAARTCHLDGSLVGNVDPETRHCENAGPDANQVCTSDADCGTSDACSGDNGVCLCLVSPALDTNLSLTIDGDLRNQPPTAVAGAAQTVECNQSGGATFTLDGSGSSDPDGNISTVRWMRGSRAAANVVGAQPVIQVVQALGGASYILRVLDGFGQGSEATTSAQVVDTTPPVAACNAPLTIQPITTPLAFAATATDVCDPVVIPTIPTTECFKVQNGVKVKDPSCKISASGNVVMLKHSEGYGTHFRWTVRAADDSGNVTTIVCEVVVSKS
jgi:hypothetical protein